MIHPADHNFDLSIVEPIIGDLASKKIGMFAAFGDIDRDDLVAEGRKAAVKAHRTYRSDKGASYTTWVYRHVHSAILDLRRGRQRDHDRQPTEAKESCEPEEIAEPEEKLPLSAWVDKVREQASGLRLFGRGRRMTSAATKVAAGALMERMKLSTRAAAELVERDPKLQEALGLRGPIGRGFFRGVAERAKIFRVGVEKVRRDTPVPEDNYLNESQAARKLGVSKSTLKRWRVSRKIAAAKLGRLVRYRRSDLDEFVAKSIVPPK